MSLVARASKMRSLTPDELRALLADPFSRGNKNEFLSAIVGTLTEEEAEALEQRINALNEQVEETDNSQI